MFVVCFSTLSVCSSVLTNKSVKILLGFLFGRGGTDLTGVGSRAGLGSRGGNSISKDQSPRIGGVLVVPFGALGDVCT